MTPGTDLVQVALCAPPELSTLTLRDWDSLIRQARRAELLGRIHAILECAGRLDQVPPAPRAHLEAARNVARSSERSTRWEVHCVSRALSKLGTELVLLKGAAYIFAGLPLAQGRVQSDLDILVPKSHLKAVEQALLDHGWVSLKLEKYDQRFYRQWSHELPPLYHPQRGTVLDVHHNILPETGRLHPNPEKLLSAAVPIPGTPYKRLNGPDMVLHASAHMFQDGDLQRGLREIADIHGLIQFFGTDARFWEELLQRAPGLDLHRPAFYAIRYSQRYLKTSIPSNVLQAIESWSPPAPALRLMDGLVMRSLAPKSASRFGTGGSRWVLYARSHWLRMPPLLLASHLAHKSLRGLFGS
jgi:hypothetical protein